MSFLTEWALAVHRAVWFPVLWMTGLEARAVGDPLLDERLATPAPRLRSAATSCPGPRRAQPSSRSGLCAGHLSSAPTARRPRGSRLDRSAA